MWKHDLALNNHQRFLCHEIKPNKNIIGLYKFTANFEKRVEKERLFEITFNEVALTGNKYLKKHFCLD